MNQRLEPSANWTWVTFELAAPVANEPVLCAAQGVYGGVGVGDGIGTADGDGCASFTVSLVMIGTKFFTPQLRLLGQPKPLSSSGGRVGNVLMFERPGNAF